MNEPSASAWNLANLRLPKLLEADAAEPRLLAVMIDSAAPLWRGGRLQVPRAKVTQPLVSTLALAQQKGHLLQGLEAAQQKLAAEGRGLSLVDRRDGVARGERISRLLLLANDGAERFYRQAERLLQDHAPRLLAIQLDLDAPTLGHRVLGVDRMARLLLVHHKQAVSAVLLDLFDGAERSG